MLFFGRASVVLASLTAVGTLVACNTAVKTAVGPKGSHIITCGNGMKTCIVKAESICGDDGYHILEGAVMPRVLGGSSSAYKTRTEVAEMTIRCGLPEIEEEGGSGRDSFKLPQRTDEELPPEEPIGTKPTASSEPAPKQVCTPGETQRCVGPGACQGGQMCLESGAGYGPCDCGDAASKTEVTSPEDAKGEASHVEVPGAAPAATPLSK